MKSPETKTIDVGSYDVQLWCMEKGGHYTPYSTDPQYTPTEDMIKAMESAGFNTVQVRAIIIAKIIIPATDNK